MKSLHFYEVTSIASSLQTFVGAQLQEVYQNDRFLGLGFYHQQRVQWIVFDLLASCPVCLHFEMRPKFLSSMKVLKPMALFLRSHFVGHRLQGVEVTVEKGRILVFRFSAPEGDSRSLEIRLIPNQENAIARVGADREVEPQRPRKPEKNIKQISWNKVEELGSHVLSDIDVFPEMRSWQMIQEEWQTSFSGTAVEGVSAQNQKSPKEHSPRDPRVAEFNKLLQKKRRALENIQGDLLEKDKNWSEVGEFLKTHELSEAASYWKEMLNLNESRSWNIENCFRHAKAVERKKMRNRERIQIVEKEIAKLESELQGLVAKNQVSAVIATSANSPGSQHGAQNRSGAGAPTDRPLEKMKSRVSFLERARAKGRKYSTSDLEAFVGKSAADNLAILRASQPHDYWMHLRDYPGAHAILRRTKGRLIKDHEFVEVGMWLVEQSLHKSRAELQGESFDVIVAETRFVRPIKGAKVGHVQYQNERTLRLRF